MSEYILNPNGNLFGTVYYYIGHFSARIVWHSIFDGSPSLEKELKSESSQIIRNFMEYCFNNYIPLDWKKHLLFLFWLGERALNNKDIRAEAYTLSLASWSVDSYNNIEDRALIILDIDSNLAYAALRPKKFNEDIKFLKMNFLAKYGVKYTSRIMYGFSDENLVVNEWIPLND